MKNVFLTGGAGFLGRSLLSHLSQAMPEVRVTVYSRDEGKHDRVRRQFPQYHFLLGDVKDYDRLELAMAGHDTVIHAAALKYVPQAETNVAETLAVNIDGSRNVAKAAVRNQVERVIGISTDKACQPVNVYGMTKLVMERLFCEYASQSDTKFNCCRYGNVVGSTGSVIPLFQRQIAESGVITLTDPSMTRFWLSVDTAVALVMRALRETETGTVLIPRLASCTMRTLAEAVALSSERTVEEKVIGVRFGEKRDETLLAKSECGYAEWTDEDLDGYKLIRLHAVWAGIRDRAITRDYNSAEPDAKLSKEALAQMIAGKVNVC